MANISTTSFTNTFTVSTEVNITNSEEDNTLSPLSLFEENKTTAEMIQEKMDTVQYVVCPTLLVFGILGNLSTILTVSHVQFHQMTSKFILYALAISDSLLLLTNPFNQHFMQEIWGRDVRALSSGGCKLFFVMYRTGKISSSWFIVLVAVERFIAIKFPLRVKRFLTKKTVCVAIATIYVMTFTLSGIWTFSTDVENQICRADLSTPNNLRLHKAFVITGAACYSIAPIVILMTLTPLIILNLYRSHRLRRDLRHSKIGRSAKNTSRVTIMLIGVVITYIICVTPITLLLILTFWTNEPIFDSQKTEYIIFSGVASSFEQMNHSSNFFVYIMCGRQFRERFFNMIRCSRKKIHGTESLTFALGSNLDLKNRSTRRVS
ncbi:neuromedin-U receptor 2-like [Mercenaria mercenaria]|uniref:neuromedin-U receptor 2-like n=1 Tax=Mercenaria mercenaria TaxID=6596 RepID=UPI00234E3D15|nr:neuromedin-U receptor 2-like [Mercenaria mercenaria]